MDHSFVTRRLELSNLRRCVSMCRDVKIVCSIQNEDYVKLLKRREAEITNVDACDAITRASSRLGLLVDDIGVLARELDVGHTDDVRRTWIEFLLGATKKVDLLMNTMTEIEAKALERILALEPLEVESGSSSYSDYSASDSDSEANSESESKESDSESESASDSNSHSKSRATATTNSSCSDSNPNVHRGSNPRLKSNALSHIRQGGGATTTGGRMQAQVCQHKKQRVGHQDMAGDIHDNGGGDGDGDGDGDKKRHMKTSESFSAKEQQDALVRPNTNAQRQLLQSHRTQAQRRNQAPLKMLPRK